MTLSTSRGRAIRRRRREPQSPWRLFVPSMVMGAALFAAYFLLPLTARWTTHVVLLLIGGLVIAGALLTWQVRAIRTSPMPLARGLGTLTVSVPLFLIVFSVTYYLMGQYDPGTWSERLSRMDALYFTMTVFATVGFGDITPATEGARVAVTVQMVGDLLVVGVITRVVVQAIHQGLRHRSPARDEPME